MQMLPSASHDPAAERAVLERRVLACGERGVSPPAELHYRLWENCHACRDPAAAAAHLDAAIRIDPLRSRAAPGGRAPDRVVLALAAPGDFQANLPLALLLDEGTELHTLFLADPDAMRLAPARVAPLLARLARPVDCAFVVIAEDDRHRPHLEAADAIVAALGLPVRNRGASIASMSRILASRRLAGIEDFVVPLQSAASAAALASRAVVAPFIVRPAGSHAGRGLARIASRPEARAYLDAHPHEDRFTVAPFVDTRGRDGLVRKLRIVFVDGAPHPLHLAIHDDWAVWYYNAGMADHPDRLAEEARFLADMPGYLGPRAMAALERLGRRVELDLYGLDAGILPDGRLVVFEIETGMIVSDAGRDPDGPRPAARIRAAVEASIDRAVGLHRNPPPPTPPAPRRGRPVRVPAALHDPHPPVPPHRHPPRDGGAALRAG